MTVLHQYLAKSTPSCNRNHQYIVDLACMPRLTRDIYRHVLSRRCTVAHIIAVYQQHIQNLGLAELEMLHETDAK